MKTFKELKYIIKYSTRKNSMAMDFSKDPFEIKVPKGTSDRKVAKMVEREYDHLSKLYKTYENQVRRYIQGEEFLIYGEPYKINIIDSQENFIEVDEGVINLYLSEDSFEIKYKLISQYLRKLTLIEVKRLVKKYSKIMDVHPEKVSVNSATSRWGSCNDSLKSVNFSLRVGMLPDGVQDYIVIHELAHLIEFNHSKDFWDVVKKYMSDYKEKELYLKQHIHSFRLK